MKRRMGLAACIATVACGACAGGEVRLNVNALPVPSVSATVTPAATVLLRGKNAAIVDGQPIAFDGVDEGLAWPALAKAVRAEGQIAIAVPRETPTLTVLRAVWTLREADIEVRTAAPNGVEASLALGRKPRTAAPPDACRAAVFVGADGAIRVASPAGGTTLRGENATNQLVFALDQARAGCPLRYVAFGAEQSDLPWRAVFDVAHAVARGGAAGEARFVLAEPIRRSSSP